MVDSRVSQGRPRRRLAAWRLSSLLLVLLLVAACGGSSADPTPGTSGATSDAATEQTGNGSGDATANQSTGDEELAEVQELRVGISRNLVNGEEDYLYVHANTQVWEQLVKYDDTLSLQPGLAESWTLSEDGLTWTFNLRDDVNFSNGEPFNAEVAVANIERFEVVSGRPSIFLGGINFPEIYGDPVRVEATDEFTLEIEYAEPRPLLPYSISNHYSAMFAPSSFDAETGYFTSYPIGTGPFVLADWRRDQYAVLERNENYWGEKPTLTKIHMQIYLDANSRLSALRAGEVDALVELGAVLPAQAREIMDDPTLQVSVHPSPCTTHLSFNGTKAPFDDIRLRQAVSMSIDRDSFVNDLLFGFGQPAKSVMISPNVTFLNDDPAAQFEYDPERAAELAQEALGGERVQVDMVFSPPYEGINAWPFPQMAAYLQAILQPLGLDLELHQMETAAVTEARQQGEFDMVFSNNCWATGDPNYILGRLTGSESALHATQHGGYNNPEVDALLAEAVVETDPEEQIELYRQIQQIAAEEIPVAPLFDQETVIAARPNVRGLTQRIAYAPSFETIYLVETE